MCKLFMQKKTFMKQMIEKVLNMINGSTFNKLKILF